MTDGTFVTISETVASDRTRVWTVNQQGVIDELKIDTQKNQIFLNDIPVNIEMLPATTMQNRSNRADNWHIMGTGTRYHVQLETYVRSATSSVLHALMFAALGPIGTFLGVAQTLINLAIAYNSNSTALFVSRRMYHDDYYLKYKYEDNYYFDRNYTDWAYCNETIEVSANR